MHIHLRPTAPEIIVFRIAFMDVVALARSGFMRHIFFPHSAKLPVKKGCSKSSIEISFQRKFFPGVSLWAQPAKRWFSSRRTGIFFDLYTIMIVLRSYFYSIGRDKNLTCAFSFAKL